MSKKRRDLTITFRPNFWERSIIDQRVELSGLHKKDFIIRSCIYSNIVVVGKRENIQRIVGALQEMQLVMKEIAGQIQSGDFSLSEESYKSLKDDYLSLVITVIDILNGAAYLFEKEPPASRRDWKMEVELEQFRQVIGRERNGEKEARIEKGADL